MGSCNIYFINTKCRVRKSVGGFFNSNMIFGQSIECVAESIVIN